MACSFAFLIACAYALAAHYAISRAGEPLAVLADGSTWSGRFSGIDSAGNLLFTSSGQQKRMPIDALAWWGACGEARRGPLALLADGSVLRGDIVSGDGKTLALDSDTLGALKIPWNALQGVVFRPPAASVERDKLFERLAAAHGDADRLFLDNGDEITGRLESIGAEKVRIASRLGALDVAAQRALALVAQAPSRPANEPSKQPVPSPSPNRCWLGLGDGTRVLAVGLHAQGPSLEWTTVYGQSLKADSADVSFIMPLGSRLKYLSDLTPDSYHFLPFLEIEWPYRNDRNVTGGMLRAGGRLYLKGIGLHSAARLTYQLDKRWKTFLAEAAIDDSAGRRGSAGFRVFVDGRLKFSSGPVRGGMPAVPVRVDLSGGKRLDLVVDYGEAGDVLDRADWLDARLVK